MSLTPILPERCGHVAPMAVEAAEGGYAARSASGAVPQGRCGHRRGSRLRSETRRTWLRLTTT